MEYTKQTLTLAQLPANTFTKDIKTLLANYPVVNPTAMGFPRDWKNEPLWQ